ncbi:MAG TPA: Mur ligase domain-containing protein, partial [Pyrinomonadaceae bacterium]|nr:Mur ligase domain-containing protein [Pyrinomonadaceae bacterium]
MSEKQKITLARIAQVVDGKLTGNDGVEVREVTHDSRRAIAGSLFVAIRGALLDAHRFIPQVMEQGAIGIISEESRPENFHGAWVEVEDARRA